MRSTIARARTVLALVAAFAMAGTVACASGGGMEQEGAAEAIRVEVENDLVDPSSVSVFVVEEAGAEDLLGVVDPGSVRSFRLESPGGADFTFRLRAEKTAGDDIISRRITATLGSRIEWDLSTNTVSVRG